MGMIHLTPEQVASWRDGGLDDARLLRHAEQCRECRAALADAQRLELLLAREHGTRTRTSHVDPRDLAAYVDARLSGRRRAGLVAHLAACPECAREAEEIAEAARTRTRWEDLAGVSAPPTDWAGNTVMRLTQLRPENERFGRLYVDWSPRGIVDLRFAPERAARSGSISRMIMQAMADEPVLASVDATPASRPVTLTVDAGPITLTVTPVPGAARRLVVQVAKHGGPPLAGLVMELSAPGQTERLTTGADGHVEFAVPPGASALRFELERPVIISIIS